MVAFFLSWVPFLIVLKMYICRAHVWVWLPFSSREKQLRRVRHRINSTNRRRRRVEHSKTRIIICSENSSVRSKCDGHNNSELRNIGLDIFDHGLIEKTASICIEAQFFAEIIIKFHLSSRGSRFFLFGTCSVVHTKRQGFQGDSTIKRVSV